MFWSFTSALCLSHLVHSNPASALCLSYLVYPYLASALCFSHLATRISHPLLFFSHPVHSNPSSALKLLASRSLESRICSYSFRISFTRIPHLLFAFRISFTRIPHLLLSFSHLVYPYLASAFYLRSLLFASRLLASRICS